MIVCPQLGWLYCGATKTGSTAMHAYLADQPSALVLDGSTLKHSFDAPPCGYGGIHTVYFTVRPPWQRFLSAWRHFCRYQELTLIDFLLYLTPKIHDETIGLHPLSVAEELQKLDTWLPGANRAPLRIESLEENLAKVGLLAGPVPKLNTTEERPLDNSADEVRQLVETKLWPDDLAAWYAR